MVARHGPPNLTAFTGWSPNIVGLVGMAIGFPFSFFTIRQGREVIAIFRREVLVVAVAVFRILVFERMPSLRQFTILNAIITQPMQAHGP